MCFNPTVQLNIIKIAVSPSCYRNNSRAPNNTVTCCSACLWDRAGVNFVSGPYIYIYRIVYDCLLVIGDYAVPQYEKLRGDKNVYSSIPVKGKEMMRVEITVLFEQTLFVIAGGTSSQYEVPSSSSTTNPGTSASTGYESIHPIESDLKQMRGYRT